MHVSMRCRARGRWPVAGRRKYKTWFVFGKNESRPEATQETGNPPLSASTLIRWHRETRFLGTGTCLIAISRCSDCKIYVKYKTWSLYAAIASAVYAAYRTSVSKPSARYRRKFVSSKIISSGAFLECDVTLCYVDPRRIMLTFCSINVFCNSLTPVH